MSAYFFAYNLTRYPAAECKKSNRDTGGYGTPPQINLDSATRCAKFPTNNPQ